MNPHSLYHRGVRRFARLSFPLCERLGFHLTPVHFYQPIPALRALPRDLSSRTSQLIGIDLRETAQLDLLHDLTKAYSAEYAFFPERFFHNTTFGTVDAEVLYAMVRRSRPHRIIEVGGGISTQITARALERNLGEGYPASFTCIEPYPTALLNDVKGVKVLRQEVQTVPLAVFTELAANDILFIDSSHVVRVAGDVNYELLEILPRLQPGVVIHLHDIYLPHEYDRAQMRRYKTFMSEQYLLQALLSGNPRFQVLWAAHFMHRKYPDLLTASFGSYRAAPAPPFSWWMTVVDG